MSRTTTTTRLAALEARVAALETVNARLVAVMGRLLTMIEERTLLASETQVELETAIRSKASKGFKIPVVIHKTEVVTQPVI